MGFKRVMMVFLGALVFVLPSSSAFAADQVEILIGKKPGTTSSRSQQIRKDAGVSYQEKIRFLPDSEIVRVPREDLQDAIRELRSDPGVDWIDINRTVRAFNAPSDPLFAQQWALSNPFNLGADINALLAWQYSLGSGVGVAVLDTGINQSHPEFSGQIASNPGETANGLDDDANGLVDDVGGWDWVGWDNQPSDLSGHGTHVSGIIAAKQGNSLGGSGLAPSAKITPLRVLDSQGEGSVSDIASALAYAGQRGFRVANLSLGINTTAPDSWIEAISSHPATLYVVAAGNEGRRLSSSSSGFQSSPCNIELANVICVGATGWDDNTQAGSCAAWENAANDCVAEYSNYGPHVDLYAPGSSIASTWGTMFTPSGNYAFLSGTSMATPQVSGIAALLFSQHPGWTPAQIRSRILDSSELSALNTKTASTDTYHVGLRANAGGALSGLSDQDHDSLVDSADNCPEDYNTDQADRDADGVGDACDTTPNGPDPDGDGVGVLVDNCPAKANPGQQDANRNGKGDACDSTLVLRWTGVAFRSGKNLAWRGWSNVGGRLSVEIQKQQGKSWLRYRFKQVSVRSGLWTVRYSLPRGRWRLQARLYNSLGRSSLLASKPIAR